MRENKPRQVENRSVEQPRSPRARLCRVRSGHEVREHFDVAARHSVAGSPSLPVHRRSVGGVSPREKIIGSRASPTAVASKAQVGMEHPPPTLRIGSRSVPSGREWRGNGGRWLHPSRNPPSSDSNGGSAGELQGGRRTRGNMQKKLDPD